MIKKLSEELFAIAKEKDVEEVEVYSQVGNSLGIRYFKGQIDNYSIENTSGISCRGLYNGQMGSAYTENLKDEPSNLLEALINNAKIIDAEDEQFLFKGSDEYKDISTYNEKLEDIENDKKIEFLKRLESHALSIDDRVDAVNTCFYGQETSECAMMNSKGLNLTEESNLAFAYISIIVKEGDDIQTGFEYIVSRDFEDFNPELLAEKAVYKGLNKLGAKPVKSGEYNVVLKNEAAANLLEAYSSIFSAEMVQKGLSLLKDKLGSMVASEIITIKDNPFLKEGFSSRGFDDEGVATFCKDVIKKGELKTYLYDLKTAKKDGVKPTGNGSRSSYKSTINIAPSNMYIEKGEVAFDNLLKEVGDGILITGLQGLHAGVNTVSGDFSLLAEGFVIIDGNVNRPVNQITIAGNFFEILKGIQMIGSDLRFSMPSGAGTIGSPSLMIGKMPISGE